MITNPIVELLQKESTLVEFIEDRAREIPKHNAILFKDQAITYQELNQKANILAASLIRMGIQANDRIAVILPNRPEFIILWMAASKIGAAIVGLNFRYQQEEVIYMAGVSRPSVMVCMSQLANIDYNQFLSAIKDQLPSVKHYVFIGKTEFPGAIYFDDLIDVDINTEIVASVSKQVKPDHDNFIIFTSGTTGKPKGAVLTQKSIIAMLRPWARNLELKVGDKYLVPVPLNHVGGGTCCTLAILSNGATVVLQELFNPQEMLKLIQQEKVDAVGGVPTMFEMLFATYPNLNNADVPSVRLAIHGGSSASPSVLQKMNEVFKCPLIACYGATEVSGFISYTSPHDSFEKSSTVGRVGEGSQLKIVDPITRQEVPQGEIGEVAVKSEMLFDRYLNLPEELAKPFDDGWFYMGDLGYLDDDGYLVIAGRTKEMYINGGFNVYPKEIEDKLMDHPAIAMAAVVGIPHDIKGEVGVAFVVTNSNSEVTEDELIEYCKSKLANYKVPTRVFFESELPRTTIGKVHKALLVETAIQKTR